MMRPRRESSGCLGRARLCVEAGHPLALLQACMHMVQGGEAGGLLDAPANNIYVAYGCTELDPTPSTI